MTRIMLACSLFLAATCSAVAQNNTMIIGDWFYQAPVDNGKLDAKSRDMLDQMFGEMVFSFAEDGTYALVVMGNEDSGKWSMNDEGTEITFYSYEDPVNTMAILSLTDSEWQAEISEGKGFVFGRSVKK
ncbi:MAG: hypothetical protein WAR83_15405 [Flavobacteriales bacterium]|nr:hypothetical protein [Flavobacteriales bacterium]